MLHFVGQKYLPRIDATWKKDPNVAPIRSTIAQLDEYVAGTHDRFEVSLAPFGTAYQQAIWNAISTVSHGGALPLSERACVGG